MVCQRRPYWDNTYVLMVQNEDLNFAVMGLEETSDQIDRMAGIEGQFLSGVRIMESSGVQHLLWRELRLTCREEIENLQQAGL